MEYSIEELKDFIHGLGWFGVEDNRLIRFPSNAEASLDTNLWDKVLMTSGVRIRFRTRCETIVIEVQHVDGNDGMRDSNQAKLGFDLYADGDFVTTFIPSGKPGFYCGWVPVDPSKEREYEIYFPYHTKVDFNMLGLYFEKDDAEPELKRATPHDITKPLVFYGSSITHGAVAQRPAITYPAIVARRLNADFINLGFGGCGKGEPEVADLLAQLAPKASAMVLDWGINIWAPEEYKLIYDRYMPLLDKILAENPVLPVLILNVQAAGPWGDDIFAGNCAIIREEIKRCYEQKVSEGYEFIKYIDLHDVIGPDDMDFTVDRVHPNQAGFFRYADAITPVLKDLLGK